MRFLCKKPLISVSTCLIFVFLFSATAFAQVPVTLTHQGRLMDNSGSPVTGAVELTFTVYNDADGGEILWQELHEVDLGDAGFYSLTLGSDDNPLDATLFAGSATFVGVQIDDNPELTPRLAFNAVPYAAVAERAQSAAVAESLAAGFSVSWDELDDVPPGVARLDFANAPYLFQAQSTPLVDIAFGDSRADASAYSGEVHFVGASDTADPTGEEGRVWGVDTQVLGHLFATGRTAVFARVKIANNSSAAPLARLVCTAERSGSVVELNSVNIIPADFSANNTWRQYLIHCDFLPNDEAQYVGIEDFETAVTDLSVDYVRLEGLPDAPYISSDLILDNAVGTSQLASGAVTSAQIQNNAVTHPKIANNAVRANSIQAGSVNNSHIANNAVNTAQLANNSVTRAKIHGSEISIYRITASGCGSPGTLSNSSVCSTATCTTTFGGVTVMSIKSCDGSCPFPPTQSVCNNTHLGYLLAP